MVTFNKFVFIVVFVLSTKVAFGQSSQIAWGIKGGLNSSGLQTNNALIIINQASVGWQAGIYSKSIVKGWGYLIEANITKLGSKQQFGSELQNNSVGYLTIPLAFQYRLPKKLTFYMGGYLSFRMWAKRKTTLAGTPDVDADIKDNVAFVDYGLHAGVSYTFKKILFDLRYLQGIQNINTNAQINARANNYSIQFSLGYFLR